MKFIPAGKFMIWFLTFPMAFITFQSSVSLN